MQFTFPFVIWAIIATSCMADNQAVKFDEKGYPELTQLAEEGFVDLVFRVRDRHVDPNGWWTLTIDAKHQGTVVGLKVGVQPEMRPGIVGNTIDKTAFYPAGILLMRDGDKSDALLRAFEMLYKHPARDVKFREMSKVTSFALDGDPRKLKTEPVKFKIFHDDQDERGEYFELYLNIDLPGGIVALKEKDEEYRPTILKGLSQPKP